MKKKILDEKCLFIAICFYLNIVRKNIVCESVYFSSKISMLQSAT